MQQGTAVPPALVQTIQAFHESLLRRQWQKQAVPTASSMGSICEIAVRVVNLHAAILAREIVDASVIGEQAASIEADLVRLRAGAPAAWAYTTEPSLDVRCFGGLKHVYPSLWVAEAWNSWRAVRVLAHQIIIRNDDCRSMPRASCETSSCQSVSIIRHMCRDLCMSVPSLLNTSSRCLSVLEFLTAWSTI